jgi:hypothetical protein
MATDLPFDTTVLDDPSASPAELVAAIRAAERAKNRACAVQARLTARLDDAVRRHHREVLRVHRAAEGRGVASEVAIARQESPVRGQRHLGLAKVLTAEMPCTLAAMEAGALSEEQAMVLARETACLDRDDRAAVDRRLCAPGADGSYPFTGWGLQRLTAEAVKAVTAIDPAALVERRARAEADRHVSIRPKPDAMAQVSALVPAAQAVAVHAALSTAADSAAAAGDPRSRGQVQADTLVERVTGQAAAAQVPLQVNLTISDRALTGGNHEPAWLTGYGTLSATTALELIADAGDAGLASLRRLYTDAAGRLVAMETERRLFDADLLELLALRDRTCRTPWCDAPIRRGDHVVPHAAGGPTSVVNGQGLCELCNLAKEAPGWRSAPVPAEADPDAGNRPHTVDTTTPAGQHVRSTAPPLPVPDELMPAHRPRAPITMELYYGRPPIVYEPDRAA